MMAIPSRLGGLLVASLMFPSTASGQSYDIEDAFPHLTFRWPVEIRQAPGDSSGLYVVEKHGRILLVENNSSAATASVFLDLTDRAIETYGEAGLLGLAFHPDFTVNGRFFVSYVEKEPLRLRVSRFERSQTNPAEGDPNSEEFLLSVEQMNNAHNGGQLQFGPDGYLYVALGDGGVRDSTAESNGQNTATLQGSILRIDVNGACCEVPYGIPSDNPFVDSTGSRPEIFAFGFRNPWRFSFDRETGDLWVGDVGAARWEEINRVEKGGNYGWSVREGHECFRENASCADSTLLPAIWAYGHEMQDKSAGAAIIGGYVYRGDEHPDLRGKYVFSDYDAGRFSSDPESYRQKIWTLDPAGSDSVTVSLLANPELHRVLTLGETHEGELLLGALYSEDGERFHGDIFRLRASVAQHTERPDFAGSLTTSYPNPFSGSTHLDYSIESAAIVDLTVYDIQGRRVRSLVKVFQAPGAHRVRWSARSDAGNKVASGTYFVQLRVNGRLAETISITHIH